MILRYGHPAQPKAPKSPRRLACEYCGAIFSTKHSQQKICSAECRRLNAIRRTLKRYRSDPAFRDLVNSRALNRRAAKLGIAQITSPATLLAYLMKRDHGRCQIPDCKHTTRRIRAKSGPWRPSIDHIVPLVPGASELPGRHSLENLQLAHYRCNLSKNNRGGGEQLALVG